MFKTYLEVQKDKINHEIKDSTKSKFEFRWNLKFSEKIC